MAAIWTFYDYFYDYVSQLGTNPVEKWVRKELSTQEESDHDALLFRLSNEPIWVWPDYDTIKGRDGLGEIRWRGDQRRTLRIIGVRSITERTFLCLLGCTHKDNIYKPPDWLETSVKRKRAFERGEGTQIEH